MRRFCQLIYAGDWLQDFHFISRPTPSRPLFLSCVPHMVPHPPGWGMSGCRDRFAVAGLIAVCGRDGVLCVALSLTLVRFFVSMGGQSGEAVDAPFLSARLGWLLGDDGVVPWAAVMASHVVSFRFSYRAGEAMAFRPVFRLAFRPV